MNEILTRRTMTSATAAKREGIHFVRSIRERLQAMQPETQAVSEPARSGLPIDSVVAGIERQTVRGAHYLIENSLPDPTDGAFPGRQRVLPTLFDDMIGSGNGQRPEDMLFLDTETTGLDRGTGTHVFLVGIGFFRGSSFTVQQHFLRDLHEEASLLCELDELMRQFSVLVTFNGRGFDLPLLATRFLLHGYRDFPELAHWDLLTWSRRLWRNRLRDCSLGNLERAILGVQRYGDVPGHMIPDLYFAYLRSRDAGPLRPVFSHNQEDIVSLARLAEQLHQAEDEPFLGLQHPVDRVSYGLFLLAHGDAERSEQLIRSGVNSPGLDDDLRFRAYKRLTEHFKRSSNWGDAIDLWNEMSGYRWADPEHAIYPLIELAKVYEHKIKDFRRSLAYVERAMNVANLHGWSALKAPLLHRYARVQRRLLTTRTVRNDADTGRSMNE